MRHDSKLSENATREGTKYDKIGFQIFKLNQGSLTRNGSNELT
jgi:hypothetical protein